MCVFKLAIKAQVMQVETFIRMPQRVVAMQWFPGKIIPEVQPAYRQVDSPDGTNPSRYISHGKILIEGKPWQVDPGDYVIYDSKTMRPIQALSETVFSLTYMNTRAFCLCKDCESRAEQALNPPKIETLEQVEALLNEGRGPIPINNNGEIIMIYTVEQLGEIKKILAEKAKTQQT